MFSRTKFGSKAISSLGFNIISVLLSSVSWIFVGELKFEWCSYLNNKWMKSARRITKPKWYCSKQFLGIFDYSPSDDFFTWSIKTVNYIEFSKIDSVCMRLRKSKIMPTSIYTSFVSLIYRQLPLFIYSRPFLILYYIFSSE